MYLGGTKSQLLIGPETSTSDMIYEQCSSTIFITVKLLSEIPIIFKQNIHHSKTPIS